MQELPPWSTYLQRYQPSFIVSQAAARQAKFDTSAVGKAARKAVENVKKEREADAAASKDNSRLWLS